MINWTVRIKNRNFWITLIPALIILIQVAASIFGFTIDLGDIGNKILAFVDALFVVLAILGIVNDPTTDGLSDSTRAMGYISPHKD